MTALSWVPLTSWPRTKSTLSSQRQRPPSTHAPLSWEPSSSARSRGCSSTGKAARWVSMHPVSSHHWRYYRRRSSEYRHVHCGTSRHWHWSRSGSDCRGNVCGGNDCAVHPVSGIGCSLLLLGCGCPACSRDFLWCEYTHVAHLSVELTDFPPSHPRLSHRIGLGESPRFSKLHLLYSL